MRVIGTCSLCGGPVGTPDAWFGVLPPIPSCASCGATRRNPHGPVIEMERQRQPGQIPPTSTTIQEYARRMCGHPVADVRNAFADQPATTASEAS